MVWSDVPKMHPFCRRMTHPLATDSVGNPNGRGKNIIDFSNLKMKLHIQPWNPLHGIFQSITACQHMKTLSAFELIACISTASLQFASLKSYSTPNMLCEVWAVFSLSGHTKVEWFYGGGYFFYSVSVSMYNGSELTTFEELHGLMWSHMMIVTAFGYSILVWQWLWQYAERDTYGLKQSTKVDSQRVS